LLKAKEELAGKKTKCPHCGAVVPIPGTPVAVPAGAKVAVEDDGVSPINIDDVPLLGPAPKIDLGGSSDMITAYGAATPVEASPEDRARRYKVLTHRDMGFTVKFDPVKLEETLNRLAERGWAVRSAVTMNLPSHAGHHDELVVILERGWSGDLS
jgi:hypothetical protein